MKTITEKNTEKKQPFTATSNYAPLAEKQSRKPQYIYLTDNDDEYGPRLLEAHVIALIGTALS
jgi:hypothetical protein